MVRVARPTCVLLSILLTSAMASARLEAPLRPAEMGAGSFLLKHAGGFEEAPRLETQVEIQVTGMVARARVTQRFRNPSADWVEGVYVFPLPEGAAVDALEMLVGERVIQGEIREKAAAKRAYRAAKHEGKKASLVEQERPNVFTTSVANLGPGEELRVRIEYQEELRYDRGRFSLRFPMVVGPRYVPGSRAVAGFAGTGWAQNTDEVPDAARITPPVLPPGEAPRNPVRIHVEIDAGLPLAAVHSPSHAIEHETVLGVSRVELQRRAVPADADFVLEWEPEVGTAPAAALFTEEYEGQAYALLMVMPPPPEQARAERLAREAVFVIDVSGSMHGESIDQARRALELALGRLGPEDRFNVIAFATHARALFPESLRADRARVDHARRWVRGLSANGGTNMMSALQLALSGAADERRVRQVVFITDGAVGNESALFEVVATNLGPSRLFTVGIGSAPNAWLMRKAARFGRGTFTFIGAPAEVRTKMDELFAKLESPSLSGIRVAFDEPDAETWPARVPDLYAGEPVVLAARLPRPAARVDLEGRRGAQDFTLSLDVQGGAREVGIHKLWARRKVAALLDSVHEGASTAQVREQVVALGVSHHLVTRYTSLLAVEARPSAPRSASLETRPVPTNLPRGWSHEHVFGPDGAPQQLVSATSQGPGAAIPGMPQAGTPAGLLLLLGSLLLVSAGLLIRQTRAQ